MAGKVTLTGWSVDPRGRVRTTADLTPVDIQRPMDAFGRIRVSEVTSLLDIKHITDKNSLLVDEKTNGTANSAHSTTNSSVTMTTAASGDYVIRQSKQRPPYRNAKSHQLFFTFDRFELQQNVSKQVGAYNATTTAPYAASIDGIFLQSSTQYSFNIYKSGTATAIIPRSDWDDPLDGTGESGIALDFSKPQILVIDYEWLGVGAVRFSFVVNGIKAHLRT
jgi:hypothetical protein